jgi:hypothetical protein
LTKSVEQYDPFALDKFATEDRDSFQIRKEEMMAQADSRVRMMAEWRVGNDPNESIHRTGDIGELTGRTPGFCGFVCWFFFFTYSYFLKIVHDKNERQDRISGSTRRIFNTS